MSQFVAGKIEELRAAPIRPVRVEGTVGRGNDTPRTEAMLVKLGVPGSTAKFAEYARQLERELNAHEEVHADHRRLVRELDVLLNAEAGAARQASLCDIVSQVAAMLAPNAAHEPTAANKHGDTDDEPS